MCELDADAQIKFIWLRSWSDFFSMDFHSHLYQANWSAKEAAEKFISVLNFVMSNMSVTGGLMGIS